LASETSNSRPLAGQSGLGKLGLSVDGKPWRRLVRDGQDEPKLAARRVAKWNSCAHKQQNYRKWGGGRMKITNWIVPIGLTNPIHRTRN
jgi:hypothetical protein